jgi:hypothetical protein
MLSICFVTKNECMNCFNKISLAVLIAFSLCLSSKAQSRLLSDEIAEFKVFPNPQQAESETYVSLQGFKAQDLLVVVYDMLGREIYSKVEVREDEGFLFTLSTDGNRLPAGVYMITAAANDRVFRQKLIVK